MSVGLPDPSLFKLESARTLTLITFGKTGRTVAQTSLKAEKGSFSGNLLRPYLTAKVGAVDIKDTVAGFAKREATYLALCLRGSPEASLPRCKKEVGGQKSRRTGRQL